MKKAIALTLACILMLSLFTIGSAEETQVGKPFMKYNEPITITCMASYTPDGGTVEQVTDGYWTQAIAEKFNINLEYVYVSTPEEYNTRVNLMLAQGNIPDILTVDLNQLHQMVEADLIQPLDSLYEDGWIWETLYDVLVADGTFQLDISSVDGHRYAIPLPQPVTESVHSMFVNNVWLETLGKSVPTTLAELEDVIYAFTNDDPDQNGINDTFGIGLSENLFDLGHEALSLANIMGAYPDHWILDENGDVVYGSVQENMKPVLEKLAQWYSDGVIDPEFTVKSYDDEAALVAEGRLGLMFGVQWTWLMGNWSLSSYYLNSPDPDSESWSAYPLPSLDGIEPTKPAARDRTDGFMVVSKDCEYPEAAALIANFSRFVYTGPQGSDPTEDGSRPDLALEFDYYKHLNDEWTLNLYHPEALIDNLDRWSHYYLALEDIKAGREINPEVAEWIDRNYLARWLFSDILAFAQDGRDMLDVNGDPATDQWISFQFGFTCSGETFVYAMDCRDKGLIVYDALGAHITPTMEDYWASLQDRELQVFTSIITGQEDIFAFDDFVAEWHRNGGDRITQEVNEWYAQLQN